LRSQSGAWPFVVVLLCGVLALTAVWLTSRDEKKPGAPSFGGGYVEGVAGAPSRLNPLFAEQNDVDRTLTSLLYAGLTRLDGHGTAFPDLAEVWSISADGRTYTFRLRAGLVWQDGSALDADDVLFTYRLAQSPELKVAPRIARVLTDAKLTRVDSRTVNIELPQPYAPLPAYLTLGILPSHLLQNVPPAELYDAAFNLRPVGAGPYALTELNQERAILASNPAYALGQPYVQRMEIRFYRDEGAVFTALRSGQVNGAFFAEGLGPSEESYLEGRKDLKLAELPRGMTVYVYLNLREPEFQDRRVRQALLYAVNRDAIIEDVLQGEGLRADSPLLPDSWAYTPSLKRYDAEPSVAAALLDDAGWLLNAQGVRTKGGVPLRFALVTNGDPQRVAVAQAVAQRWTALGARVTVEARGTSVVVRDMLEPRAYEAALFAEVADPDPDPYEEWHSSQTGAKGANLSNLNDPRFDRVLEQGRLQVTQPQRKELYAQFQELFAQEVPAIPLYVPTAVYVQTAELKGAQPGLLTDPGGRFWQVQEWFLKTR
jgi:peptide/nickel transport system substrate-binding protein